VEIGGGEAGDFFFVARPAVSAAWLMREEIRASG